jgi:hypothetical protein
MTVPAMDLSAYSVAMQLQNMDISVDQTPFDLRRYPYLIELFDTSSRYKTILKGGQMGFTSFLVLKYLAGAAMGTLRGVGIYFPSHKEAGDFANARVDPMLSQGTFRGLVNETNTQGLKMINGTQFYMRGAGPIGGSGKASKGPVKSIPLDWLGFDEMDEMLPSRVDAAEHRLDGSKCPEQTQLSTPTLPNFGVDLNFQESDKRRWFWICPKCGKDQCLELEYPDCIALPTGMPAFYICRKCREVLERYEGLWVPECPQVFEHRGYSVSQMCSPTRTAQDIVTSEIRANNRGMLREYWNQVMGIAWAEIQDMLTKALLDECATQSPRSLQHEGPCCMGVDLGRYHHHYVVKMRTSAVDSEVLDFGRVDDLNEIDVIARRFNVRNGVIDQQAETHAAREFIDAHPGWFGCEYVVRQPSGYQWDEQSRVVKVARTTALDASQSKIIRHREKLPRPDERYLEMFVPQMCNLGRTRQEDPETGKVTSAWVRLGKTKNDHLRHAHTYATLAEERAPLATRRRRNRQRRDRNRNQDTGFLAA